MRDSEAKSRQFIGLQEAAVRLRKSPSTMSRWIREGGGPPYYRIGGTIHYDPADIDRFIGESRVVPNNPENDGG